MQLFNPFTKQKVQAVISRPWFFPMLICFLVNGFGFFLTFQMELSPQKIEFFRMGYDGHKSIISIVATSLMTLIAVSFSISMLILSTLSNQFGPRLLPSLLHSRITQITLGFFLATYLFCLFCLFFDFSVYTRAVQSIYVLILAISCIMVLVLFVNFVMNNIQINNILQKIKSNSKKAIKEHYHTDKKEKFPNRLHPKPLKESRLICIQSSGYVQAIDYQLLKKLTRSPKCFVELKVRPGDFIISGHHIITLYQLEGIRDLKLLDQSYRNCIRVGESKEGSQDIEFGYEQIAEIAVRALSPGINDPYTARNCIWIFSDLFVFIDKYQLEISDLYDGAALCGWCRNFTYEGLVHAAMNRIRQAAKDDLTVLLASYDMISQLVILLKKRQLIIPLMQQAKAISEMLGTLSQTELDNSAIKERKEHLDKIAKRYEFDWWF